MSVRAALLWASISSLLALGGCQSTDMQMGSPTAKTTTIGGAAGSRSVKTANGLERCESPLGTMSLVENVNAGWYTALTGQYGLPPTSNLLRLMAQQSNCFVVVERSAAGLGATQRERAIMQSGDMRSGSDFGRGQMVASDYALSPELVFSNNDAGGLSGIVGGLLGGGRGRAVAAIGGSMQTREAAAMLTLIDNRSGVQLAVSEGSASKTDIAGFGGGLGRASGGFGGYSHTTQGKVVAAAFMDAYNQMVVALRSYQRQNVRGQGLGSGGQLPVDGAGRAAVTVLPATPQKRR